MANKEEIIMAETVNTNATLDKTFALLESMAREGLSVTVAEIARMMGVSRITAQNIVNSLEIANYIEKDESTGEYSLGYQMMVIGSRYVFKYPFLSTIQKQVTSLSRNYNVKVNVGLIKPDGKLLLVLTRDVTSIPTIGVGTLYPGNLSANGKVQLAFASEEKREHILSRMKFVKSTKNSIVDPDEFRKQLDKVREQGYATEGEEVMLGRCCISAPVFDIKGECICSISISCTKEDYESEFDRFVDAVQAAAAQASSTLGYQPMML